MTPLLRVSGLSGRVMLLTRYRVRENHVLAITKHDVTDEFVAACEEWRKLKRRQRAAAARSARSESASDAPGGRETKGR